MTARSRSGAEAGFTLIEMLVALAVFSLAALALLRLGGATATSSAQIETQTLAGITARNIAAETLTDAAAPPFGSSGGEIFNAGRRWRYTRLVARSPEPRIQQITIQVLSEDGRARSEIVIFRRAGA